MIVYKNSIQPSMVSETPAAYEGNLWKRLSQSKFRSSFTLKANDRHYVIEKVWIQCEAMPQILSVTGWHLQSRKRRKTDANERSSCIYRATRYRYLLPQLSGKWHHIPKGRELTETEQKYVVDVIMEWIKRQMQTL